MSAHKSNFYASLPNSEFSGSWKPANVGVYVSQKSSKCYELGLLLALATASC